jgi:hypothetical protein
VKRAGKVKRRIEGGEPAVRGIAVVTTSQFSFSVRAVIGRMVAEPEMH